ncbi:hypothetical protein OCH239_18870 [Roseivivax halodurans JCM 10272]|uniref:Uncharacterized protein n=1 Tax=Roseivivax halodurans JCM 10272 TaxID=1449350 RepID=X7E9V3_9RHOB|nr:hypothetical protein OCH239_18870 [Roseivivax halodurans JCM 10272]
MAVIRIGTDQDGPDPGCRRGAADLDAGRAFRRVIADHAAALDEEGAAGPAADQQAGAIRKP